MVTKRAGTKPNKSAGATVTLKDIAAYAGVSQGAASSVLSGGVSNIRVAPDTQSRVLEAAQSLGYRSRRPLGSGDQHSQGASATPPLTSPPSASILTKALTTVRVGIITSFNPGGTSTGAVDYDPWEQEIPGGFEIALNAGAAQIITHYCNRGRRGQLPMPFEEALAHVLERGVDALALIEISSSPQVVGGCIPPLMRSGLPFVVISTDALSAPVANVYFDNVNAGYQAAQHLLDQGYREIFFLAPIRAPWADERIVGAREALLYAGIPAENLRVFPDEADRSVLPSFDDRVRQWDYVTSGRDAGERLLNRENGIVSSAVITINDSTAVGFLTAAEQRGFHPGVDYALVGFDDAPAAREHGLTTIRPPREAMGREAAHLMMRLIRGEEAARVQMRLNSHLMVRGSTPPYSILSTTRKTAL